MNGLTSFPAVGSVIPWVVAWQCNIVPPLQDVFAITFEREELVQCCMFHCILHEDMHQMMHNMTVLFDNIRILKILVSCAASSFWLYYVMTVHHLGMVIVVVNRIVYNSIEKFWMEN